MNAHGDGGMSIACVQRRRAIEARLAFQEDDMLRWAVIFAIIAIVAGLLGFTGVAAGAASIAKILALVFLVLFVVALIAGSSLFRR